MGFPDRVSNGNEDIWNGNGRLQWLYVVQTVGSQRKTILQTIQRMCRRDKYTINSGLRTDPAIPPFASQSVRQPGGRTVGQDGDRPFAWVGYPKRCGCRGMQRIIIFRWMLCKQCEYLNGNLALFLCAA